MTLIYVNQLVYTFSQLYHIHLFLSIYFWP
jgi:hypothetical protein